MRHTELKSDCYTIPFHHFISFHRTSSSSSSSTFRVAGLHYIASHCIALHFSTHIRMHAHASSSSPARRRVLNGVSGAAARLPAGGRSIRCADVGSKERPGNRKLRGGRLHVGVVQSMMGEVRKSRWGSCMWRSAMRNLL